jgi:carbamoylphosphate synthase large subunit
MFGPGAGIDMPRSLIANSLEEADEAVKEIGGTNVQFAHDPRTGRVVVIEIKRLPCVTKESSR